MKSLPVFAIINTVSMFYPCGQKLQKSTPFRISDKPYAFKEQKAIISYRKGVQKAEGNTDGNREEGIETAVNGLKQ